MTTNDARDLISLEKISEKEYSITFPGYKAKAYLLDEEVEYDSDGIYEYTEQTWELDIPYIEFGDRDHGGSWQDLGCNFDTLESMRYPTFTCDNDDSFLEELEEFLVTATLEFLEYCPPISHEFSWNVQVIGHNDEIEGDYVFSADDYTSVRDVFVDIFDDVKNHRGAQVGLFVSYFSPFNEKYDDFQSYPDEQYWFSCYAVPYSRDERGKITVYTDEPEDVNWQSFNEHYVENYGYLHPWTLHESALK